MGEGRAGGVADGLQRPGQPGLRRVSRHAGRWRALVGGCDVGLAERADRPEAQPAREAGGVELVAALRKIMGLQSMQWAEP